MNLYAGRVRALAASLSALAGYVDALAFLKLGGFFVSFMSGNSTRLGVGVAQASPSAAIAAGLVASFVLGVLAGALIGRAARRHRRLVVLALVSALLALAAILSGIGATPLAVAAMAMAMGAENAVFERDGDVSIGLTYMTGALVKMAHRLASALMGGDRLAWLPHLMLWLGLVAGAAVGATVYRAWGLGGL